MNSQLPEPETPSSAECDEEDPTLNTLTRSSATVGFKRPLYEDLEDMDGDSGDESGSVMSEDEEPDLASFFSLFKHIQAETQIALCRSYANYLANKIRAKRGPAKIKG